MTQINYRRPAAAKRPGPQASADDPYPTEEIGRLLRQARIPVKSILRGTGSVKLRVQCFYDDLCRALGASATHVFTVECRGGQQGQSSAAPEAIFVDYKVRARPR